MGDPLPPDPYQALGVAKDATAAAIKTQYRKLVLKCHPDKVKDETEKQEASDKFHKIQSAWEIIGDEARRKRYDAQVHLQELKKDIFSHGGEGRRGADVRTASYKMPTESARGGDFYAKGPDRYGPRVSPQYEERVPSYAQDDYFEERSRPSSRKYDEYERSTKRAPPKEERERPRKENERSSRKEKSRRTDKDVRRDRDRKQSYVEVVEDDSPEYSSADDYARARRTPMTPMDDPNLSRARNDFFQNADPFAREEAGNYDERTSKSFRQFEEAKAHMERSRAGYKTRGESESREPEPRQRRPSPVRMSSSKDKVKSKGIFGGVRHGSGDRPKTTGRDTGKSSKAEKEPKSSDEDRRGSRRTDARDKKMPNLAQSKSQPPDVRPSFQRQRSHSMQDDERNDEPPPTPGLRRAETTPLSPTGGAVPQRDPRDRRRGRDAARLHPESAAYPTPGATPEPESKPVNFKYGRNQTYADDNEVPTPDGYVLNADPSYETEVHAPTSRGAGDTRRASSRELPKNARYTRSPSPMKAEERQGRRSSSARHTTSASQKPSMGRTTSYKVEPAADGSGSYSRPVPSRENSGRETLRGLQRENSGRQESPLYREVPRSGGARSGSPRQQSYFSVPAEEVKYSKRYQEGDFNVQSGYSRRESGKPSYGRNTSGLGRQTVLA